MQKMENSHYDDIVIVPEIVDPDLVQAEIVEGEPGTPWQWPVPRRPARPRYRWRLAGLLFAATCLSTLWAGYLWHGGLANGLLYAVPVMTILFCHEMGHFLQSRRYGVRCSLPYFLPMPLPPLGTFGAVIVMEPRIGSRRALFDIGISGPLAGLVPTLIFLVVGLHYSHYELCFSAGREAGIGFGKPLLFQWMTDWLVKQPQYLQYPLFLRHSVFYLNPMAFAGWVGLLVTSLNLIPIGQLDGGHVLYALLRRKAHFIAKFLLLAAVVVVFFNIKTYFGWTIILCFLVLMGPIHPPTANDDEPLGIVRTILGWLTLAFIAIGFTPTPIIAS
jgi:membrane-associated protease RseP (regulator of RpoE activity)